MDTAVEQRTPGMSAMFRFKRAHILYRCNYKYEVAIPRGGRVNKNLFTRLLNRAFSDVEKSFLFSVLAV